MATVSVDYPTSDGRPMAETDLHRDLMVDLIQTLQDYYADDPDVYVSGNLLLYYVEGDRRRHLSPDVFVVKGVPKGPRLYYLLWQEGRGPDVVIELTSASTRDEDVEHKMGLYRDVLKVPEYFLFDPNLEYLDPALQGYRLQDGAYVPIEPVEDRLPSEVLGLHLERDGERVRLFDPQTRQRLRTPLERGEIAEAELAEERAARQQAEAELERLRRELEQLRRPPADNP
jgi:Uma2 family endonuclease